MKKIQLAIFLSFLLIGCSDTKDLVIPRETANMNEFSENVKNLNPEEKYLLNEYLNDYIDEKVPVGMTVKEAIKEQRELMKEFGTYNPPH